MTDPYQPPQQPVIDPVKPPFSVLKLILGMFLPVLCAGITLVLFVFAIGWAYSTQANAGGAEYVLMATMAAPTLALLGLEIFFLVKRQRELALGVAIGFGLIVLLVAACFGVIWLDTV